MALRVVEAVESAAAADLDPVCVLLAATLEAVGDLVRDRAGGVVDGASEAVRVDRITGWERLRAAVAAGQATELVGFAHARVDAELAAGADPGTVGVGVVEEIGLACHTSPWVAARRLSAARAWTVDLPGTFAALTAGELSERAAETVVAETRHLDARLRRHVDTQVVAAGITGMSLREAAACARRYAYEADRAAYVARGRHERAHRRVGLRPAPDTMAILTAYLPVEHGVACLAALTAHTDRVVAAGDPHPEHDRPAEPDQRREPDSARTRDQIMADTLVERLTGQIRAADVPWDVQILIPADLARDPDAARTATIGGAGPLPGRLAHQVVDTSNATKRRRRAWTTHAGQVVAVDRRRRRFTGPLATLITLRDQTCRAPFCSAPIRHLDHITPFARGGTTDATNGQGLCERHNHTKQAHGWTTTTLHDGHGEQPHTVQTMTPTGHTYRSRAPDPP